MCKGIECSTSIPLEIIEHAATQNPSEAGFKVMEWKWQKGQNQYNRGLVPVEETSSDLQNKSKGSRRRTGNNESQIGHSNTNTHMQTFTSEQPNGTVTDRAPAPFTPRTIVCWAGKKPVERALLVWCVCLRRRVFASWACVRSSGAQIVTFPGEQHHTDLPAHNRQSHCIRKLSAGCAFPQTPLSGHRAMPEGPGVGTYAKWGEGTHQKEMIPFLQWSLVDVLMDGGGQPVEFPGIQQKY